MAHVYRPLIVPCLVVSPVTTATLAGCTEDKNAALRQAATLGRIEEFKRLPADAATLLIGITAKG